MLCTLSKQNLEIAKSQLDTGQLDLKLPYMDLIRRADRHLKNTVPYTVTVKTATPPSGDKHDYMSISPYCWPNKDDPAASYTVHGQVNPAASSLDYDQARIRHFSECVYDLSLAWYFTGQLEYKTLAEKFLRAWFLDTDTRMNPHFRFSQGVPGVVNGTSQGLIESRYFAVIIDCIGLLEVNPEPYRNWFKKFYLWLVNSSQGQEADGQVDHQGTFYDAQVAVLALFIGASSEVVKMRVLKATSRTKVQFDVRGQQPEELKRSRAFHYSVFNLCAYTRLAQYGVGVDIPVWNTTLLKAVEHLAMYLSRPKKWPHHHDTTGVGLPAEAGDGIIAPLLIVAQEYGPRVEIIKALKAAREKMPEAREWLLWPIQQENQS